MSTLVMWPQVIVVALAAATAVGLARCYDQVRGTTLTAAWVWGWAAWALGSAAAFWSVDQSGSAVDHARYLAAVGSFGPPMAVFGAKRPQHRAWSWIVASLMLVLCLPSGSAWLYHPRGAFEWHGAWQVFLAVLVLLSGGNYLGTRLALPGLLYAFGQALLLGWPAVPESWGGGRTTWQLAGVSMALAALGASGMSATSREGRDPLARLWLDFRDRFGVVWALRVAERVNSTLHSQNRTIRLAWHGPETTARVAGGALPADSAGYAELDQTLRTLLARFVSNDWVSRRCDKS